MNITERIMRRLQEQRLWAKRQYCANDKYAEGFIAGLDRAETIAFEEQEKVKTWANKRMDSIWQTGNPTETGDYVLIIKAHFDSEEDGIKDGNIYITTDFLDDEYTWESFTIGDNPWELLYFTKLSNIRFKLPSELGIKRNDETMFLT